MLRVLVGNCKRDIENVVANWRSGGENKVDKGVDARQALQQNSVTSQHRAEAYRLDLQALHVPLAT